MGKVTPLDVLDFWIGDTREDPAGLQERHKLWFGKSREADRIIAERFVDILAELASGLAHDWAARGPRARLAAIIALDQFTRNIFRDTAGAFENDPLALALARRGIDAGEDVGLSEAERIFFYMPLEHSERIEDQEACLALFRRLVEDARPGFAELARSTLDYAVRHRDVIARFGRFPHRNVFLGRAGTPQEDAYLAEPGAGF